MNSNRSHTHITFFSLNSLPQ